MIRVAALFIDPLGHYPSMRGIDAWDEARDARQYTGPHPVVAHPPCQLWGKFARINFARWGGEHNRPGNDGGCFASALLRVRLFGGVLEHPARSYAWDAHGLTRPSVIGWQQVNALEWVCEVWQSAYGHKAAKATWLWYHGDSAPRSMKWGRPAGTHQVGRFDVRKSVIAKRAASATPPRIRSGVGGAGQGGPLTPYELGA